MSSLQQLVSNGIALMEGNQTNNLTGALSEFLQGQGLNINEIWQPSADIIESENNITVYINIPGVKMKNLKGKVVFKKPNKFKIKAKGIFFLNSFDSGVSKNSQNLIIKSLKSIKFSFVFFSLNLSHIN
jgi:hypothetical protein